MTLQYIIKTLEEIALLQPNINSCGNGDIYNFINGNPQIKYSLFFVTQGTHREQNNIDYYNLNLFYLDRLTQDKKNNLRIQSTAKECLSNIIKSFCETFDVEVNSQINYTPFTETFSNDLCSGVYCNLTFEVMQETDCAEQYGEYIKPTIQVINNEDITIISNGTYFPQQGFSGFGKVEVNVSVDDYYNRGFQEGIAEQKSKIQPITITENGEYVNENGYSPINVNLDLESIYEEGVVNGKEEQKSLLESIKITENGVYDNENGFDVVDVEIDTQSYYDNGYNEGYNNGEVNGIEQGKEEQKSLLTSITITENGNYTNENGYNEVIVNVGGEIKPKLPNGICLENSTFSTIDMGKQDWSNVYDWSYMFYNCTNLTEIQNFPTDIEVLATAYMFYRCNKLTSIPQIDTSNVTNMNNMFRECQSLTSIPQIDTSNVVNMTYMFHYCDKLETIPQIDTSNVVNMNNMFSYCRTLTTIPQIDTSNVTNMSYMFQSCSNLLSIPQIDTSNVTDMTYMFRDCRKLISIPELDISNVTNVSWMFGYCHNLEEVKFKGNPQYLTNVNNVANMFSETGKNVDNPKMYYPQEFETNYQKIINLLPNNWTAVPY